MILYYLLSGDVRRPKITWYKVNISDNLAAYMALLHVIFYSPNSFDSIGRDKPVRSFTKSNPSAALVLRPGDDLIDVMHQ